jgi:ribonuclease BN (tRNA processing enzyme)
MEITILGCGDAFGSGGRLQTSFFIYTGKHQFLLDCGATIVPALHKHGLSGAEIDGVIITHFHGDHYGGLPYFLLEAAKRYKRKKPLSLISPPGLKKRLEQLLPLLYPGTEDVFNAFPIEYRTFGETAINVHDIEIQAWEVVHAADSLPHGLRIRAGEKVLAFSGDTTWHENLIPISAGADLFICECNFWKGENSSHLSWEVLKKHLGRLSAKTIRLTHAGDDVLERQDELSVKLLSDGEKLAL